MFSGIKSFLLLTYKLLPSQWQHSLPMGGHSDTLCSLRLCNLHIKATSNFPSNSCLKLKQNLVGAFFLVQCDYSSRYFARSSRMITIEKEKKSTCHFQTIAIMSLKVALYPLQVMYFLMIFLVSSFPTNCFFY